MKTLILLRHGKSSWDTPELADFDRPLLPRGQHDAELIAEFLKAEFRVPDRLITSPARRARETARIVAVRIGYELEDIEEAPPIYEARVRDLLDVVRGVPASIQTLLLVGHNPGFSDLAATLSPDFEDVLPTCGLVALRFSLERWDAVRPGSARLHLFERPKHLRD